MHNEANTTQSIYNTNKQTNTQYYTQMAENSLQVRMQIIINLPIRPASARFSPGPEFQARPAWNLTLQE